MIPPDWLNATLGLDRSPRDLSLEMMALRTLIVLPCALLVMRLASRRFLGRNAGFDIVFAVILGSVISRGINGQAAFFPTLGAGFLLVLLHRLLAIAACRSHRISRLLKGGDRILVRNGHVDDAGLRRAEFSRDDLLENLRLHGNVSSIDEVAEARLERNGEISVVRRER